VCFSGQTIACRRQPPLPRGSSCRSVLRSVFVCINPPPYDRFPFVYLFSSQLSGEELYGYSFLLRLPMAPASLYYSPRATPQAVRPLLACRGASHRCPIGWLCCRTMPLGCVRTEFQGRRQGTDLSLIVIFPPFICFTPDSSALDSCRCALPVVLMHLCVTCFSTES